MVGLWGITALAGVSVQDNRCVSTDQMDNELRLQLGDALVDHLYILVRPREDGMQTVVREKDRLLWSRTTPFTEADCPVLPEAIALSVQQGLAAIPDWTFDTRPKRLIHPEMHVLMSAGLPLDSRFGVQGGLRIGSGRLQLWTAARLETGPPVPLGEGAATWIVPTALLAPVLRSLDGLQPAVWTGVAAGPAIAFGSRFDEDRVVVLPRVAIEVGGGVRPTDAIHLGLNAQVPVVRPLLQDNAGNTRTDPWVRLGITAGLFF